LPLELVDVVAAKLIDHQQDEQPRPRGRGRRRLRRRLRADRREEQDADERRGDRRDPAAPRQKFTFTPMFRVQR
jgi:Ni/Co efflux regulator RcnB